MTLKATDIPKELHNVPAVKKLMAALKKKQKETKDEPETNS